MIRSNKPNWNKSHKSNHNSAKTGLKHHQFKRSYIRTHQEKKTLPFFFAAAVGIIVLVITSITGVNIHASAHRGPTSSEETIGKKNVWVGSNGKLSDGGNTTIGDARGYMNGGYTLCIEPGVTGGITGNRTVCALENQTIRWYDHDGGTGWHNTGKWNTELVERVALAWYYLDEVCGWDDNGTYAAMQLLCWSLCRKGNFDFTYEATYFPMWKGVDTLQNIKTKIDTWYWANRDDYDGTGYFYRCDDGSGGQNSIKVWAWTNRDTQSQEHSNLVGTGFMSESNRMASNSTTSSVNHAQKIGIKLSNKKGGIAVM